MLRVACLVTCVSAVWCCGSAAKAADLPAGIATSMPADPVDNIQGDYEGVADGAAGQAPLYGAAKVIAEGKGGYRVVFQSLKGDARVEFKMSGKDDRAATTQGGSTDRGYTAVGQIAGGKLTLTVTGRGERVGCVFERVVKHSPTEGAKPPDGAVVLLPYEAGTPTSLDAWTNKKWLILPDGSVQVKGGGSKTVKPFGDCRLHVEFRCPYMPDARGQGRGNSGVYLQDRFEVQVLDSFGLPINDNECGGIYKVAKPKVNASLPPLSWQTYDMVFRAPRLDESGKMVAPALITVEHNGVLIHDKVELKGQTGGGAGGLAKLAPIMLQDHGNAVRYRNIWLVELKEE